MALDRKQIEEYRVYRHREEEDLLRLEEEVRKEQTMPWIRPAPRAEELPDENYLVGLRETQRMVLRRMRLRTLRLVNLWRHRGSSDFRMAARELYRTMRPFRIPKHDNE